MQLRPLAHLLPGWIRAVAIALVLGAAAPAGAQAPAAEPPAAAAQARALRIANKPWTGDFDRMLERRIIRVSVPYSRSLYFIDKGRERGIAAELVRDFERWINQKYAQKLGKRPLTIYIVAATRDKLLPEVRDGLADIAIGNLTVTDERRKVVDFVAPAGAGKVDEIVVTGPSSPAIDAVSDLSGKTVHVRPASSYYESLVALNERLRGEGRPEVVLEPVPDALEDEDMLEMLNAGLLQALVVDDWKAKMWAQVLPRIVVHDRAILRDDARTGWAIRQGSPRLAAELEDFYASWAVKQGVIPYRQQQYMRYIKALNNPQAGAEWQRFEAMQKLFEKYGRQYGFDPLMLAAQGYQESTLDQSKKSHVGAIGVMQIMPATGASLKVGDISLTESNIHAGAKYMDQLMTRYFPDAKFSEVDRALFAFASYNCGPGNVAKLRKEAAKRGLDPDRWFNNVEVVTAEKIGVETTTYVRNIYKYYVSYKLTLEAKATSERLKQQVAPARS